MNLSRRGFLSGLVAAVAPAIIRTPGLLMPIKPALGLPPAPGFLTFEQWAEMQERMPLIVSEAVHEFTFRTSIPAGAWRAYNVGISYGGPTA